MPRALSLAEIFQLGYYWETKILLTAVKLDLFTALGEKDRSAAEVARRVEVDERALELMMNALVAIGLLTKQAGRFSNSDVARSHLVKTSPSYVGHLLLLHEAEWANWGKLEEIVRAGHSSVKGHLFESDPEMAANVLAVLDRIGQQSGPLLAQRLDLGKVKTLLDLGGGAGTNAIAFCKAYPQLRATIFDLPKTLEVADRLVKEAGLESRITRLAGNFNANPLGAPYDVILMSDVLHYQGPEANAALVKKTFHHLVPGGRLVIKDRFLDESGTSPAWVTAFAVHILINTEHGRCYTAAEAARWMTEAGFEAPTELERTAVIQGRKP